jgi:hypothetical protein
MPVPQHYQCLLRVLNAEEIFRVVVVGFAIGTSVCNRRAGKEAVEKHHSPNGSPN